MQMHRFADMHMHLGFAVDARMLAHELQHAGIAAFSCTVTPDEYDYLIELGCGSCPDVMLGLGLHPWYVDDPYALPACIERIAQTPFIGELGLDFSKAHEATKQEQLHAFEQVLRACAREKGKLVSMHAVHTKGEIVDIVETTGAVETSTCILHSFAGSSDELKRAIEAGFYFSVGARMLASKRGREYARVIPESQLLLETDLPTRAKTEISAQEYLGSLEGTLLRLSEIRACHAGQLAERIWKTSGQIIGKYAF